MLASKRQQVVGRGVADLGDGRGRWTDDARDHPANGSDPPREHPGHVIGTDVLLPMAERLLAQEHALPDDVFELGEAAIEAVGRRPPESRVVDGLVRAVVGKLVHRRPESAERSCEGTRGKSHPSVAIAPERRDAVEHRADGRGVERRAAGRQPSLFDADDLELSGFGRCASRLVEEPADVVEHFAPVVGVRWQAVHHDDERKAALADAAKHVPRHAVGIARRGRDEDAEVGGLDQPVGDDPVGVLDGVDVRRVDDCKAGGGGRVADQLDLSGVEP